MVISGNQVGSPFIHISGTYATVIFTCARGLRAIKALCFNPKSSYDGWLSPRKFRYSFNWRTYEDTDSFDAGGNRAGFNRNDRFAGRCGTGTGRRPRWGYRL